MPDELNREISIVYDLLFGYTDKMENIRQQLDVGDFQLPVKTAMVIKIKNFNLIVERKSEFRKEELQQNTLNKLNELAAKTASDILSAVIDEDMLVLFFSTDFISNPDNNEEIKKFASKIKNNLEDTTSFKYSIGLGRSYNNLKGLIFSYKEALNSCKSCYFQEKDQVMHVDEMVEFKNNIPIFISEMETKLLNKIQSGELENIDLYFQEIINNILSEKMEPEKIKIRILELVYKVIEEIEKATSDSREALFEVTTGIKKILKADTRKELNQAASDLNKHLFDTLRRYRKGSSARHSINQALDYIEDNYEQELSLRKVSEEIGLSLYYFSHLFKEEVGESFVTYLNKFRVRKAKHLLLNSNLNIAEISYQVGYNDPNYFTRVFKEYVGSTPSEFRLDDKGLSAL
ncbi:MAG: helix-turn-helix domain-containing protein [Halanaerobiales bacterium]